MEIFEPYYIEKEIEGVRFNFFIGDSEGQQWYHKGCTDPDWPEMRFMKEKIIREGDVIFECGSHHGCTTILLSEWVGFKGKVLAFEPNFANFEILKTNIALNPIANVELFNKAVGKHSGEIPIDTSTSNSSVLIDGFGHNKCNIVKMINLDYFEEYHPDVLKIDVEGFEKEVLIGAEKILKTKPKLAIELHTEVLPHYGTSVNEIFELLNRDQYIFWVQWEDNQMPMRYNFDRQIIKRVHLFALPKQD